jgi:hypothetical protein
MDPIVAFYQGGPDSSGRKLEAILAWDDEALEGVHDYIQWLFPTKRASAYNPDAPLLTDEAIAAFRADPVLRGRVVRAFERMLVFYGFELSGETVTRGPSWESRREAWVVPGDHNHLRITRILDCLSTVGLGGHAKAFLRALDALDQGEDGRAIGARTFRFWREAVRP